MKPADLPPLTEADAAFRDMFEVRVSDDAGDFGEVLDRLAVLLVNIAERELAEADDG